MIMTTTTTITITITMVITITITITITMNEVRNTVEACYMAQPREGNIQKDVADVVENTANLNAENLRLRRTRLLEVIMSTFAAEVLRNGHVVFAFAAMRHSIFTSIHGYIS